MAPVAHPGPGRTLSDLSAHGLIQVHLNRTCRHCKDSTEIAASWRSWSGSSAFARCVNRASW